MSLFAIIFALLIEQVRPLHTNNPLHRAVRHWARACARSLNAGRLPHARLTWAAAVVLPALLAWAVHIFWMSALGWVGHVLEFFWHVAVLYATLGFRQFSHHFSAIRDALETDRPEDAAKRLAQWKRVPQEHIAQAQTLRLLLEHSSVSAHRHVFGVLISYAAFAALGLGPAGAVVYRMAEFVARYFSLKKSSDLLHSQLLEEENDRALVSDELTPLPNGDHLSEISARAWYWIDYWPARLTALGFAVVGRFEEVLEAWRNAIAQSLSAGNQDPLIIAATLAALRPSEPLQIQHLQQLVGLVWRTVVLWLLLIALLSLARLLG